jgi:hypothetical protein
LIQKNISRKGTKVRKGAVLNNYPLRPCAFFVSLRETLEPATALFPAAASAQP